MQTTHQWIKHSSNPVARSLFKILQLMIQISVPAPKIITSPLYAATITIMKFWTTLTRVLWWTPIFKGRINHIGKGFYLYGGMPFVSGSISLKFGDNCRVSGQTTLSGRSTSSACPLLTVGNNVDIGWQTTIAVGTKIIIYDNVRIAGCTFLAGYPGHPMNASDRAAGLPELDSQVGDIILERDVWLATGVSVLAGVTIGQGTIIAAGSVVTSDLPPFVIAGGIPAKILRTLTTEEQKR